MVRYCMAMQWSGQIMNQCIALEGLEAHPVCAIEEELLALNANLNAATYRFLVLAREFDRRMAWADWGMRSMAHWLGWKCGIGSVAAREQMRVTHALVGLPDTAAAFACGRISYSKVRALSRVATRETEGFFLNIAEHGTAGHLERIVRYAKGGLALDDPERLQAMVENIACDSGCTHEQFLHAHHIQHWSRQGETSLTNLVTICSFHHTLLHEGGYSVRRLMDGCYGFKTPAGRVILASAPAMHGGAEDLRIANQQHGVDVSAETGASHWDGSPVDYHHVMLTFFQYGELAKYHAAHHRHA